MRAQSARAMRLEIGKQYLVDRSGGEQVSVLMRVRLCATLADPLWVIVEDDQKRWRCSRNHLYEDDGRPEKELRPRPSNKRQRDLSKQVKNKTRSVTHHARPRRVATRSVIQR